MNRDEMLADLQATVDYAGRITELADSFDFETLADVTEALRRAQSAIRTAEGMLEAEMVRQLEAGEKVYNGQRFYRTQKYTERTDHEAVVKAVAADAGLHDLPEVAALAAARRMEALYLSKSSNAKKGEVDKLSIARDAVFSREYTGWKIEREDVAE